jgi:hypothetical protein
MIDHIIFLVHPLVYVKMDAESIRCGNLQIFLDREIEIKARWLSALTKMPDRTLFIQQCGPEQLVEAACKELGEAYAVRLGPPYHEGMTMHEFYVSIIDQLQTHLDKHELSFDPATVTSELWGESFEGCAPGYGGMFAQYLGLQESPRMRFEMTLYDSRWLYGATEPQVIPIDGTDVEAWVFECHDGTGAAIYQARRHAQWIDQRRVSVQLNTMTMQVCLKSGHTVWPKEPWAKGMQEQTLEYSMTLIDGTWRWIRGLGLDMDTFREVISATRVLPADSADGSASS